jgi:ABC-type phosphate transport system substrate-binding protein
MNLKSEFIQKLPLASCLSIAALAAVALSTTQPVQAQSCVLPQTTVPGQTLDPNCTQYFGSGATFPAKGYRGFFDYYGIAIPLFADNGTQRPTGVQPSTPVGSPRNSTVQYNYCLTGSGSGRDTYLGLAPIPATCLYQPAVGLPASFAVPAAGALFNGTDVPLSASEISTYATNTTFPLNSPLPTATLLSTRGNPIQVPTYFGAIVVAVNPANSTTTSLTTAQLCKIFDGTLTTLNGIPLTVYVLDNSSTTRHFTTYLAAACPAVSPDGTYYLTAGVNTFPTTAGSPSTAFQRRISNDAVANAIATAGSGGIGYIENASSSVYMLTTNSGAPSPVALALENPLAPGSAVPPTVRNIQASLTGTTLIPNPTYTCVLNVGGVPVIPTVSTAYPIISPTYVLTYSRYPLATQVSAVGNLFRALLANRSSSTDAIAQSYGYSVLFSGPNGINSTALRAQARSCILTATSP